MDVDLVGAGRGRFFEDFGRGLAGGVGRDFDDVAAVGSEAGLGTAGGDLVADGPAGQRRAVGLPGDGGGQRIAAAGRGDRRRRERPLGVEPIDRAGLLPVVPTVDVWGIGRDERGPFDRRADADPGLAACGS